MVIYFMDIYFIVIYFIYLIYLIIARSIITIFNTTILTNFCNEKIDNNIIIFIDYIVILCQNHTLFTVVIAVMYYQDKGVQIIFKKMVIKYSMYYIIWLKICQMAN